MNRAESERLEAHLIAQGYTPAASAEEADVFVINSCVVRQHAENKVINRLYRLRHVQKSRPGLRIVLTGCFTGQEPESLRQRFPYVDDILKPGDIPAWLKKEGCASMLPANPGITALVPITQGCNNFCSYCIVPYRRGRETSRPVDEIVSEVKTLVERGAKEVTLLGQNVDSYGHDLPDKPDLALLLEELNRIDGLWRIRFLTNHPKDMNRRLIKAMAHLEKVCRAINLPAQAGDDTILKAMNRGYTAAQYSELVAKLRDAMPDIAISTDIIVGFPGESDEQFKNTYKLLEELRFDAVHVAAYSIRPGTLAAKKYADDVPEEVKKYRLAAVEKLQEEVAARINSAMLGQPVEVLAENMNKGRWQGRTRSDKIVFFTGGKDLAGRLVNVHIEKTSPWSFQGKV
jgi:tRNA-2-methylthio-N6-dimethylallyladenosine synthase